MSRERYHFLKYDSLIGATVASSVLRAATDYRYHVTLDFGVLDDTFRTRLLSALKTGYTTVDEVRAFMQRFYKEYKFVCGYIGKSQAYFPLPAVNKEEADSFKQRVKASCVMAGLEKGVIIALSTMEEVLCISVAIKFTHHNRVYMKADRDDSIEIKKKGDQLVNRLDFLKGIAAEIGAETFPQREAFYNMVLNREKIECDLTGRYEYKPEKKRSKK